jgi:F-type H+/Na+-transporting ATPase subunit alpha
LTALPIIETLLGDISAYIPTNVISITDGQLFMDGDLFNAGQRPAVDTGLSVSRVGGDAQTNLMRKIGGPLKGQLAQFRSLAAFAQFGSDLDKDTQRQLDLGMRLTELLKQPQYKPDPVYVQGAMVYAGARGYLNEVPLDRVKEWEDAFVKFMDTQFPQIRETVAKDPSLASIEEDLKKCLEAFKETWS